VECEGGTGAGGGGDVGAEGGGGGMEGGDGDLYERWREERAGVITQYLEELERTTRLRQKEEGKLELTFLIR
jgi:hypothetical protein